MKGIRMEWRRKERRREMNSGVKEWECRKCFNMKERKE
jgi:hypothetical protein